MHGYKWPIKSARIVQLMGKQYTISNPFDLEASFLDSRPDVPIFFFLSPGVDVMSAVEALAARCARWTRSPRSTTPLSRCVSVYSVMRAYENVGKYQSCMVSKLRLVRERIVLTYGRQ